MKTKEQKVIVKDGLGRSFFRLGKVSDAKEGDVVVYGYRPDGTVLTRPYRDDMVPPNHVWRPVSK